MRFRRGLILLLPFVLSHCATQHQPTAFAPFFPEAGEFTSLRDALLEIRTLESRTTLAPLEKKRLLDLYVLEQRSVKHGSQRFWLVQDRIKALRREVAQLDEEVREINQELRKPELASDKKETPVSNAPLRKEIQDIQKMWNRDETPAALARLEGMPQDLRDSMSKSDRQRVLNLRLRMVLELGDLARARTTYLEMKDIDDCHVDTTQAGFLVALHLFINQDSKSASEIFETQCDSDESAANRIRRKYWSARFKPNDQAYAQKAYEEVASSPIPGYHGILAQLRLGKPIVFRAAEPTASHPLTDRDYLKEEISVSRRVAHYWERAEERLKFGLRRDAGAYLRAASRRLRDDPDLSDFTALLYTAHLCAAAGEHLEALKLHAEVTNLVYEAEEPQSFVLPSLFQDMFPRPFAGRVEWLARMWDVDPDFVYSIMRQESGFNPAAVSIADARGLMQLMPSLGRMLAKQWNYRTYYADRSLFAAAENLKLGIFHLNQLRGIVPHYALIAGSYNAGINRVLNWWKRYGNAPLDVFVELIPITETRNYIKLVMRNYFYYKYLRTRAPIAPNVVPFELGTPTEYEKQAVAIRGPNSSSVRRVRTSSE